MRLREINADIARYRADAPPAYLLNILFSGKFRIKKIERSKKSVTFTVKASDRAAVEALLEKKRIPYKLLYIKGVAVKAKSLIKRFGLIGGAVIGIMLAVLYYCSLTEIKIAGNKNVSTEIIADAVKISGIKTPSISFGIDLKELEEKIIKIDGISAVSVRKEGTHLYIEILEELAETDITDTQTPTPIVAEDGGVVTRIIALQGTPLVKAGDSVRKGDVLIAPYITDAEGVNQPLKAMGEVYARVWYERRLMYGDTVITAVRTGRTEKKTAMWLLGLEYIPSASFSAYQTESNERSVAAVLPFKIINFTFYETEDREIAFDFDSQSPALIEKGFGELEKNIPDSALKLRKWYIIKKLDKYTQLSIYYEVEKRI